MGSADQETIAEVIVDLREYLTYLEELGVSDLAVQLSAGETEASIHFGPIPARAPETNTSRRPHTVASTDQFRSDIKSSIPDQKPAPAPGKATGSRLSSLPTLKERKPSKFFDKYNPPEEGAERPKTHQSREHNPRIEVVSEHADVTETVPEIHAEIGPDCTRCKLSQLGRSQVVNSVGNPNAELMFCGEAPGADEDRLGEPFVGRAGQLLTDIIEKGLGMPRKEVFIGNINRCRPPGNRAPEEDESSVCKPFLLREIAVVRPRVIVTLGATATQNLLETKTPIGKLRGKFHEFGGCKVMPTFHPAYLLRDPKKKREVWEDMKIVRDYLRNE